MDKLKNKTMYDFVLYRLRMMVLLKLISGKDEYFLERKRKLSWTQICTNLVNYFVMKAIQTGVSLSGKRSLILAAYFNGRKKNVWRIHNI